MDKELSRQYLRILEEELIPALGCTEPIAIAYAAAMAKDVLGTIPESVHIHCSGNIIKNVKSVVVPNTNGLRGIEAAALAGIAGGSAAQDMEVLSQLDGSHLAQIAEMLNAGICRVSPLSSERPLHIIIELTAGAEHVRLEIQDYHTNIVGVMKNGQDLAVKSKPGDNGAGHLTDRQILNVDDIYTFAQTVEISRVSALLKKQVDYNMAMAQEGLRGNYGVDIGNTLLQFRKDGIFGKIKAYTAAASEARMGGSELPVIINSGSGNQGIASSVPVIIYAQEHGLGEERLYRAMALSNLLTIHQKTLIGRLSAFCGVVSASCSSGAAITYLAGGTLEQIKMTITNTLANVSGIVCDGAKPSCGIKIAASLEAALMAHLLAMNNKAYLPGDGLIKSNIEDTISSVGRVAHDGMKETDEQILKIMLEC